jgi:phenylacetate-CoA ligase
MLLVARYVLKVNAEQSFNKEAQLITEFKTYLGEDADFKIEHVNEIPLLNSGKRRKLVNEMGKNSNVSNLR